ncbi:tRNA (adenosine(37)-N6)-threonylcarbamoyltransferase complex dimerization subunit type 1 TsaB [Noviherbaspirillum sedimenti]|uniref:tRNA (Adenosine(37)-N6)-threonylcarbamoyltransferase complex dimerization subunit type 1 TsaB n=1 Tax=Noviherbaspirillum sedimenti TaxID=2320865 RepID=A0A3A3FY98_9BURK|nr:tRNA (adenosine(37)-N6)-threonylcarbamoyltransferase complex dimerization subunit type 1 TsaB [Noviherbaspirillum sedimenti]RJG01127.1 tRNA (adenosine(37)-N6)-threonylcarbamoyltransferase complex dimerization subunit type 1 TsaB [Noviherbaspirillum sedimenti]
MPTILAIETSAERASAALLLGDQLFTQEADGGKTHSAAILPLVQRLLGQAGIRLEQCEALAFGSGPGSFTGVRTAAGVVQGLAFGSRRPVIPVVTLLAMAQACRSRSGAADVLAILDARMGEVYWAQYRYEDRDGDDSGGWREVVAPTLSAPAAVAPRGTAVACGNGLQAYADAFAGAAFAAGALPDVMPHALQIAQLARLAFARGETLAAQDAQPLYLRNKVALTTSERLAKAGAAA